MGEEDEDEGDEEGHESVNTATFKRKSSVPMVDTEEDYSKLIDTSNNAVTANETLPMDSNKRRHKSSLSMIDDMHAQKLSKTDFDQLKNLVGLEGPSDRTFRAGDISINKTILDGSVIIHTGRNPLGGNNSNNRGTFTGANGYDFDTYYGVSPNVMDTQLNISCFDTPNNYSVADHSTPNQAAPSLQGLIKQSSTFGTLDALRKKLKEKKENDMKGMTVTVSEPKNEAGSEQVRRVPVSTESKSTTPYTVLAPKQEPTPKQDPRISRMEPSSHIKNNSSMWSMRFGKIGGYASDIKHSFIFQTTEDDFLNNEWERILHEVEKQANNDPNTTVKEAQQKKEMVTAARKKYLRQLVKGTTVFAKQGIISQPNENQKAKKVAIASNMIEYYNGENIGVEGKDNNLSIDEKDMGPANNRTINDAIFSLLLIEKHMMHMNIVSDYEIKK